MSEHTKARSVADEESTLFAHLMDIGTYRIVRQISDSPPLDDDVAGEAPR